MSISEKLIPKIVFNTHFGKFEFIGMPFGLMNALASFQIMMNTILQPYLGKFCLVYLDNILIFSRTLDEHHNHVQQVLETLRKNDLYAKSSKCLFAQN